MSSLDDYYDAMFDKPTAKERHDSFIKNFEGLSLEEKVEKLIEILARRE